MENSKYLKFRQKYLNLKKQIGGNVPYLIKDENLDYFHIKCPKFNSSITMYGEKHHLEYNDFLLRYMNSLYLTNKKQLIIVEKNILELGSENNQFKILMKEATDINLNIMRKKMAIGFASAPILYFSAIYKHGGNFPNTEIICGDVRLRKIMELINELEEITTLNPEDIIDTNFLARYKQAWEEQISILISNEFLKIKNEVIEKLLELSPTMKNNEIREKSNYLNKLWVNISNIGMLEYVKQNITKEIDITLFVGQIHIQHLIEEIQKIFFHLCDGEQENVEDNFDTNPKYSGYWFFGKERLSANDIEPNVYYNIRLKNKTEQFTNYKLKGYDKNKIILEQADWMSDEKIIEFNINDIYLYKP